MSNLDWKKQEEVEVALTPLGEYYIGPEGTQFYSYAKNMPEGSQTQTPGDEWELLRKVGHTRQHCKVVCETHYATQVRTLYQQVFS